MAKEKDYDVYNVKLKGVSTLARPNDGAANDFVRGSL